jgi:hypothetical protein
MVNTEKNKQTIYLQDKNQLNDEENKLVLNYNHLSPQKAQTSAGLQGSYKYLKQVGVSVIALCSCVYFTVADDSIEDIDFRVQLSVEFPRQAM